MSKFAKVGALALGAFGLEATTESNCAVQGGCDVDDEVALLAHRGSIRRHGLGKSLTEDEIYDIIEEEFKGIDGPGSFLETNLATNHGTRGWTQCLAQNYPGHTKDDLTYGSGLFGDLPKRLGIDDHCEPGMPNENDPTCRAIYAFFNSTIRLQKLVPEGPKFYNYFVTDWGRAYGLGDSWFGDAVGKLDLNRELPRAEVKDPNGMNGFMVCDTIRTILMQDAEQESTFTCSFFATWQLMSRNAPAQAMKLAARLLWTGRTSKAVPQPCSDIISYQPGMVTPRDNGVGVPYNPLGVTAAWYQSLVSAIHQVAGSDCDHTLPSTLYNQYMSEAELNGGSVMQSQIQFPASIKWNCNHVVDPVGQSCQIVWNTDTCGDISEEHCQMFMEHLMVPYDLYQFMALITQLAGQGTDGLQLKAAIDTMPPPAQDLYSFMAKFTKSDTPSAAQIYQDFPGRNLAYMQNSSLAMPSATEEMLKQACASKYTAMLLHGHPLNYMKHPAYEQYARGKAWYFTTEASIRSYQAELAAAGLEWPDGSWGPLGERFAPQLGVNGCDHYVVLEACDPDADKYTIWTWGYRVHVNRATLIGDSFYNSTRGRKPGGTFNNGIVCTFLTADQITVAQ